MGLLLPRHYITGGIIFTMIILSVVGIITTVEEGSAGDGSDAVSGFINSDQLVQFNRTFNIKDNVTSNIRATETSLKNLKPTSIVGIITLPIAFIDTAWKMIKLIISSFDFMSSAFNGISTVLGFPEWVPLMITLLVIVLFVFSILTLIFGKEA